MSDAKWNDNAIQFPRLLAEIMATQEIDLATLAESMDLSIDDVNELFDRADQAWESAKAGQTDSTVLTLNIFDDEGRVVDTTTTEMSLAQISDVVDHASQAILVRRSGGDINPILDELDEALSASNVLESSAGRKPRTGM